MFCLLIAGSRRAWVSWQIPSGNLKCMGQRACCWGWRASRVFSVPLPVLLSLTVKRKSTWVPLQTALWLKNVDKCKVINTIWGMQCLLSLILRVMSNSAESSRKRYVWNCVCIFRKKVRFWPNVLLQWTVYGVWSLTFFPLPVHVYKKWLWEVLIYK